MKRCLLILLFANATICILLGFLTGTYTDTLTMLCTSIFTFVVCIVLSGIMSLVKKLKKFAPLMLLNSVLLPCIFYIIFEVSSSYRSHNLYVMYHFETQEGDYQVYVHNDTNAFSIDKSFDGGSEGIVSGTYTRLRDNEYKLHVSHASSYDGKHNELLIKNDSIYGFNGASYSISTGLK